MVARAAAAAACFGGVFFPSAFRFKWRTNGGWNEGGKEGGRSGERANAAVIYAATFLTTAIAAMNSNAAADDDCDAGQVISFSPFYLSGLTAVRLAKVGKPIYG